MEMDAKPSELQLVHYRNVCAGHSHYLSMKNGDCSFSTKAGCEKGPEDIKFFMLGRDEYCEKGKTFFVFIFGL